MLCRKIQNYYVVSTLDAVLQIFCNKPYDIRLRAVEAVERGLPKSQVLYSVLHGDKPSIEHWRPRRYTSDINWSYDWLSLSSGVAAYKNRVIKPRKLFDQIKMIQNDIVAVGVAISPMVIFVLTYPVHPT